MVSLNCTLCPLEEHRSDFGTSETYPDACCLQVEEPTTSARKRFAITITVYVHVHVYVMCRKFRGVTREVHFGWCFMKLLKSIWFCGGLFFASYKQIYNIVGFPLKTSPQVDLIFWKGVSRYPLVDFTFVVSHFASYRRLYNIHRCTKKNLQVVSGHTAMLLLPDFGPTSIPQLCREIALIQQLTTQRSHNPDADTHRYH